MNVSQSFCRIFRRRRPGHCGTFLFRPQNKYVFFRLHHNMQVTENKSLFIMWKDRLQDRPLWKQDKTAHLITALVNSLSKQEMRHQRGLQADKEHLWGRETSVFPCKVLCPDETHTFPEWNWLFLGTQSLFVSHICSTIPLCGERLASYQSTPDLLSPSYPCWKHTELPVTALARREILLGC